MTGSESLLRDIGKLLGIIVIAKSIYCFFIFYFLEINLFVVAIQILHIISQSNSLLFACWYLSVDPVIHYSRKVLYF